MTMHPSAPYAHLTRNEYEAHRADQSAALAALAAKWNVDAIGRHGPENVTGSGGYRYVRAGKWYVVRGGEKQPASASQARALNAVGLGGVGAIYPVAATPTPL